LAAKENVLTEVGNLESYQFTDHPCSLQWKSHLYGWKKTLSVDVKINKNWKTRIHIVWMLWCSEI